MVYFDVINVAYNYIIVQLFTVGLFSKRKYFGLAPSGKFCEACIRDLSDYRFLTDYLALITLQTNESNSFIYIVSL